MPVHYDRVFFFLVFFFHYYFSHLPSWRVFVPPHLTFVCQTSGPAPRRDRYSGLVGTIILDVIIVAIFCDFDALVIKYGDLYARQEETYNTHE